MDATIVAARIRAEIGVGPSMALGNYIWRGNWADLAIVLANNRKTHKVANKWYPTKNWRVTAVSDWVQ